MTMELWVIVLACSGATFLWRFFGVVFGQQIDPNGAVFEWVSAVSYAMVAGLIFRFLVFPDNELANVSIWVRAAAAAVGFGVFFVFKQSFLLGCVAGSATMMLLVYITG